MNPDFHINNTVGRNPLQAKWKYKDLRTLGLKLIMIKECGCYVCHYLYCRKSYLIPLQNIVPFLSLACLTQP